MPRYKSEKVFSLEMTKDNGRIKISAYERSSADEKTIRHYEFHDICDDEIRKMCASVVELLNRTNHHGKISREILKELQTAGQLLYDSLLTSRVKERLAATHTRHLILSIDDRLVQIPWELLFDGNTFLCQRFNMGRIVSTGQRISEPAVRSIGKPLKMLVIADPKSNLEASYREGVRLKDELDKNREIVNVHLQSSNVDINFVKGALRDFDIFHYAGHADYDIKNPSNSGFLMEDGKFRSSDIIRMIGPKPLPSLVFSNACKSGHTEIWKVGKDYETEIYGLANAFLLVGVRHYIGSFWDIQDEPGYHFSLDFYKELMHGGMVGEAVRKARLQLIERYGEDTVIWASYMLYGDPTFRYMDPCQPEEKDERREVERMEETEVLSVGVRGMDETAAFPTKKWKWILIGSAFLLSILVAFHILRTDGTLLPRQKIPAEVREESKEAKEKRISELVAALIKDYEEGIKKAKEETGDVWRSKPLTLVFMNIKAKGITEAEKEYILSKVSDTLQGSKRLQVVEREVLDKLLEELKLSSSQLADPASALRVGRILSARLISTGSIIRDGDKWQVSLRMIETETTSIKAALVESMKTEEKKDVAEMLSQEIIKRVKAEYPLQGRVLSIEGERVVLDIGSKEGVKAGLKMEVLSGGPGERTNLGEIEIASVEETRSHAILSSSHGDFREGFMVKEL